MPKSNDNNLLIHCRNQFNIVLLHIKIVKSLIKSKHNNLLIQKTLFSTKMKNYLHFFILMAAIVIKISSMAMHFYVDHTDDLTEEKCELCVEAINNQELESFTPIEFSTLEVYTSHFSEQINFYNSVFRKPSLGNTLFGRPPPEVIS